MTSARPILVVDDERDNRNLLRRLLEFSGFEVVEANDGFEALHLAQMTQPSMVLLDLSMPHLDGWQTARRLRALPALARVPIMAVSANAMVGDADKALAAGCDDYISKPIDVTDFLRRVRAWH
jgi:CheY-like chemotaxis protein